MKEETAVAETPKVTAIEAAPKRALKPWEQALVTAEGKFIAITDPEKAKIELGFAAQILQNSTALQGCEHASIMNAVINVARTSITLNPVMKLAYLVPRDGKCVLDFSYMGLVKMLKDNGCVKFIDAFIVYDDEEFSNDIMKNEFYHIPKYAETEAAQKLRKIKGVYSRVILPDNSVIFTQFMPNWEIEKIRKVSKAQGTAYSPWNTFFEEMVKKTKIKRDFKMLISGSVTKELERVLEIEEENNGMEEKYKANRKLSIADTFLNE